MTVLQVMYGTPVVNIKSLCEHFSISDRTARTIIKEMQVHRDRYGDFAVMGQGALKRVNYLAFTDYWKNRTMLQEKNGRKYVPAYEPQKIACALGFYGGETCNIGKGAAGNEKV